MPRAGKKRKGDPGLHSLLQLLPAEEYKATFKATLVAAVLHNENVERATWDTWAHKVGITDAALREAIWTEAADATYASYDRKHLALWVKQARPGERRSYAEVAEMFPCVLVRQPAPCYAHETPQGLVRLSPAEVTTGYRDVLYVDAEGEEQPFLRAWLADPAKRAYERVVFEPPGAPQTPDVYNLWRGWPRPGVEGPPETYQFLLDIIYLNVGEDDSCYAWYVGFLAHMVQRPGERPGRFPVFYGPQGAGKDFVLDALVEGGFFGTYAKQSLSPHTAFFGKFNGMLKGTILARVNESEVSKDQQEGMKQLATAPEFCVEEKGKEGFMQRNCLRLWVSSERPLAVEPGRRPVMMAASTARLGDKDFWDAATAAYREDGVLDAFWFFLETFDLSGWDARQVLNTEHGNVAKVLARDYFHEYLQSIAVTDDDAAMSAADMQSVAEAYMPEGRKVSSAAFAIKTKPWVDCGVFVKEVRAHKTWYKFNLEAVRDRLKVLGVWLE